MRPGRRFRDRVAAGHVRSALLAVVVCGALLGGMAAPAAAQSAEPTPGFVVTVRDDGSATVAVTYTFDLTNDAERAAFRTLADDADARADAVDRFRSRLRAVANATENATGRSMAVTDAAVDLATTPDNEAGVATFTATWRGLAAERDGRLVVTEPFASEFAPDRRFVLRAPGGYRIASTTPAPATSNGTRAAWAAGADLPGFEAVLAPADSPTTARTTAPQAGDPGTQTPAGTSTPAGTTDTGAPGFGVVAVLLALAAGASLGQGR